MPTRLPLVLLILFMLIPASGQAVDGGQPSREFAGKTFVLNQGDWYQVDSDGTQFRVKPDVFTVKFHAPITRASRLALHAQTGATVVRTAITGYIDLRTDGELFEVMEQYAASGLVESVEPNTFGVYHAVPNDPQYGSQWYPPIIGAEAAWETTAGSPDVAIAVLDSGTEFNHEDLGNGPDAYGNVWLNPGEDAWSDPTDPGTGNGIDDDGNGFIDDWKGWNFGDGDNDGSGSFFHGTAVAGVVAAKTDNALGMAGIGGGFADKGLSVMISGVGNNAPDGSVLDDAILYAAENGARVIQLSLSVGQSSAIDAALEAAYMDNDMLIACSSGNSAPNPVAYPARNEHVMAVGATTQSDQRANFSQFGDELEIAAPGQNILTLDLNDGYGSVGGTSFASPIISAVAGMIWSVTPWLGNDEVRALLQDTADKVGGYDYNHDPSRTGHSVELGYGRVNIDTAIETALSLTEVMLVDGFETTNQNAFR